MDYLGVLIFSLDQQEYAIEIEYIERIISCSNITKLIDSEDFVEGIVEYENDTLIVINFMKLFHSKNSIDNFSNDKIIVMTNGEFKLGLKVDSVTEVITLKKSLLRDIPLIAIKDQTTPLKGVFKKDDKLKLLLDAKKIFDLNNIKKLM